MLKALCIAIKYTVLQVPQSFKHYNAHFKNFHMPDRVILQSSKMPNKNLIFVRNDRHYKEVRRTIARNQKKKQEQEESAVEES